MTTELQEYKCPSCGHQLGEIEYREICDKHEKLLEELAEQRLVPLKIQYEKEMQQLQEKHDLEKEKEVDIRVEKQLNQEKVWIELRHKQELAQVRQQDVEQLDEKVKHAIIQNEAKHLQTEKQYELKLKRVENQNNELRAQVEKQQKTIEGIPSELRGTAGEFVLLQLLQKEFTRDIFTTKKNGKPMADIIQTIVTETGESIPTPIVYDVKMGDNVTKSDIAKAKNYMLIHNTPHSIIVTKDIKNEHYTEVREGILLVHSLAVIDIAQQIRKSLIETRILIKNNLGRDTKQSKLYDYFTSQEYTKYMRERIEFKFDLDNINRKEEALRNKRDGIIGRWFDLDNKQDGIVRDISQGDIDIQNQTESNISKEVLYLGNKDALLDTRDDVS